MISSALKDWIPFRLQEEENGNSCRWLYLGNEMFVKPFFEETISRCRQLPENSKMRRCISSAGILKEWAPQIESIAPTAIIFHVSRCGSTLLSQLLSLDSANICLSEVPFFDELLRWGHRNQSPKEANELLKAAVALYGAKRNASQQNLFIKADSWHVHFYKELRELYPDTPLILLYRRPDEVIRSHQKERGMQAVQGVIEPWVFGFDETIFHMPLDDYMAKVMETYLTAFINILQTDKKVIAVNYNDGMLQAMERIAAFSGYTITDEIMEQMKERLGYHAKFPGQVFAEPSMEKAIPGYLVKSFELYEELAAMREKL